MPKYTKKRQEARIRLNERMIRLFNMAGLTGDPKLKSELAERFLKAFDVYLKTPRKKRNAVWKIKEEKIFSWYKKQISKAGKKMIDNKALDELRANIGKEVIVEFVQWGTQKSETGKLKEVTKGFVGLEKKGSIPFNGDYVHIRKISTVLYES